MNDSRSGPTISCTGGHGNDEYFGPPDKLNDHIYGRTAESCNVYKMLKLTRTFFAVEPDPRYAEFLERALFNHVLGSIDSNGGSTCYMVPVGQGVYREYADTFRSFTCCVDELVLVRLRVDCRSMGI